MTISLRHKQHKALNLEDRMYLIIAARVRDDINHPQTISKKELFKKVVQAAKSIDIKQPAIYEWDKELMSAWFTDGCLRESQFIYKPRSMEFDIHKDIGYFIQRGKELSIRSFEINAYVFSDKAYSRFQSALESQGLEPSAHDALGTVFPDEAQIKSWKTRKPLY